MKIGIFKPGMNKPGGTETFLKEVIKRISKKHEVYLVTDRFEEDIGAEVIELPMLDRINFGREWFEVESISLFTSSILRRTFKRLNVDVWSTHYVMENMLLSRYVSEPNFFRFPGIKRPHIEWRLMSRFAEPTFYLANSKETKRRAEDWFDIKCVGLVRAGVDTEQFRPDVSGNLAGDEIKIMYVGRIDRGKGLFDLLKAFYHIIKDSEDLSLWFIGEGSLVDKLKATASKLNIEDKIHLPGRVDHSDIHRWFASSDIFCLPSYHEGFPIVNLEAMASGKPVVSTDIASIREQITDGEDGLLFKPGDVNGLRNILETLINDAELREGLGKKAREKSLFFDWSEQAEKMECFYKKAIVDE